MNKQPKNKLDSLTDHLLNTIEKLQNIESESEEMQKSMLENAKVIAACGNVITNAAKEQNKYLELRMKAILTNMPEDNSKSNLLAPFEND